MHLFMYTLLYIYIYMCIYTYISIAIVECRQLVLGVLGAFAELP